MNWSTWRAMLRALAELFDEPKDLRSYHAVRPRPFGGEDIDSE